MNEAQPKLRWRRATASGPQNNCVEVANLPPRQVAVRDSKDVEHDCLRFPAGEWSAFLGAISRGTL
ncbi:DUF397 domain-containing protein [Streptomyces hainanensis]|uniref:DUF397 domain-containing protein n=1 Tax=Streptomyces hainanensis TaxID=402648 RepID=A0A4R4TPV5_9ACTN|nr:DUF397 domain-containing protein [Streptomyces hainanensis]TDC79960.1 DUF397 domain-containing protein [Streptomyces hainanensis]